MARHQPGCTTLANAVRHGSLKHPIYVTLGRNGDNAAFAVRNDGEAIPVSAMPFLFTPGDRHSAYAAGENGSSSGPEVGLIIAPEIVAHNGGSLEAESNLDTGTIFSDFLPIRYGGSSLSSTMRQ
ncbi:sensor histidine kinase [Pseudomonas proteolytica]|uniref:sensor histidine kinase n=1 Tax=Pseudomonas TaxID=286 RepID=UPI003BB545EF